MLKPFLFLLAIFFLEPITACLSLGGCGFSGCLPIPTLSFGCGRFCRMAKGAKTFNTESHDTTFEEPDTMFQKCCAESRLPPQCMQKCTYRTYTKEALTAMFFKGDSCPIEAAQDIHRCAAQLDSHSDCCYRNQIHTTLAGEKCNLFCDQRPSPNVTRLDVSYVPCMDRFEQIKTCFWQKANDNYQHYIYSQQLEEEQKQMEVIEGASPSLPNSSNNRDVILTPNEEGIYYRDEKKRGKEKENDDSEISAQIRNLESDESEDEEGIAIDSVALVRDKGEERDTKKTDEETLWKGEQSAEKENTQTVRHKPWYMYDD